MAKIPHVSISQPHIEQLHKSLDQALQEVAAAKLTAEEFSDREASIHLDEIGYLVLTVKQSLPPQQMKHPF